MLVTVVQLFTLLNILLLAVLLSVWGKNWWQIRSKHTLGLVLFSVFLLGENLMAAYWFMVDPTLSWWIHQEDMVPRPAQIALATFRALQFIGLAFLTWVTWD